MANQNKRPKTGFQHTAARRRLAYAGYPVRLALMFQHTAARRRLGKEDTCIHAYSKVSTHSRPKAAGAVDAAFAAVFDVSTHSRPKAAGRSGNLFYTSFSCFNTQPPEGGWEMITDAYGNRVQFQHTAARRRLDSSRVKKPYWNWFQHTAARRRLAVLRRGICDRYDVSTHSRPKAAGASLKDVIVGLYGFNTQPPEGGWSTVSDVNRTRK